MENSSTITIVNREQQTKLLIALFAAVPIVDTLNGLLLKQQSTSGSFSLGVAYRLFFVVVLIILSTRIKPERLIALSGAIGCLVLLAVAHQLLGVADGTMAKELKNIGLWMFAPITCCLLLELYESRRIDESIADRAFDWLCWIAPLTILIPYLMGVGFTTYKGGEGSYVGYKAFYYATNAVTFLLIMCFYNSTERLILHHVRQAVVPGLLCAIALILIGTKSAYVMIVLSVFLCVFEANRVELGALAFKLVIAGILLVLLLLLALLLLSEHLIPIWNRAVHFLSEYDSIASFLSSGRVDRIPDYLNYMNQSPPVVFLIGIGDHSATFGTCEMDYFDAFFQFGAVGLLLIVGFSAWIAKKTVPLSKFVNATRYAIIVAFAYALIVGHVFDSALSSTVLSLLFLKYRIEQDREKNRLCQIEQREARVDGFPSSLLAKL